MKTLFPILRRPCHRIHLILVLAMTLVVHLTIIRPAAGYDLLRWFVTKWWQLEVLVLETSDEARASAVLARGGFHPEWHPKTREERFPSIEERVKLYTLHWYQPPCPEEGLLYSFVNHASTGLPQATIFGDAKNTMASAKTFLGDWRDTSPMLISEDHCKSCPFKFMAYCHDTMELIDIRRSVLPGPTTKSPPILYVVGDDIHFHPGMQMIPYFTKTRPIMSLVDDQRRASTLRPLDCQSQRDRFGAITRGRVPASILWPLETTRHFKDTYVVSTLDTKWEKKKNLAIWRGALTGPGGSQKAGQDFEDACLQMPRCKLALQYKNSKIVDVGLTNTLQRFLKKETAAMATVSKKGVSKMTLLEHKAIIILQGNDVASGLKWALYSSSVVLAPIPTVMSFAMEQLLEPWVHFIPLEQNLSDVEERMQWILDHDDQAQKIAERATLFIHDLMFHERAEADNIAVLKEVMMRYLRHYQLPGNFTDNRVAMTYKSLSGFLHL